MRKTIGSYWLALLFAVLCGIASGSLYTAKAQCWLGIQNGKGYYINSCWAIYGPCGLGNQSCAWETCGQASGAHCEGVGDTSYCVGSEYSCLSWTTGCSGCWA